MPQAGLTPIEELIEETQTELEQTERDLKEIRLMVNQSRSEVDKLTQRNAQVTTHLRQMQGSFETIPRSDIKAAYEAAQDAQQRLFTMRGQLEKLQSDQTNLERLAEHLRKTLEALQGSQGGAPGGGGTGPLDGKPMIVRVVEAQEAERQRLSRQIHDGPAQALSNFILQSEIAMRLFEVDPERAKAELASLKSAATTTFQKVRDFIFDLRPMMLDDLGLVPTLKRYVDAFKEKSGIQTTLTVTGTDRRLDSVREVMIFRGLQELLGNVRNHAQASQVRITFDMDDNRARTVVEDNGKGFEVETAFLGPQKTIGLSSLKERMELLGGRLEVESQPGQGTRVVIEVPVSNTGYLA
jgi:two-component system sensor histidine kinase DegS